MGRENAKMIKTGGEGSRNLTFGLLEALGREIVTGRYDGERFPTEDELTARFEVSRTVTDCTLLPRR